MLQAIWQAHAATTLFMTGLIWFVQIVHYPLMGMVPADVFAKYEMLHRDRTGWIVAPVMLIELGTAVALAYLRPGFATWIGIALLAVIWLSTWLLQVPAHVALSNAFDEATHMLLVRSNWIRTIAWSLRSTVIMWLTWNSQSV